MPKPKYVVSTFEKDLLLHNIYMKTGIIIQTKRDCGKISKIVSDKNKFISESTVYRLFVLRHKNYTPYMHTLNLLARFCGYENWADLVKKNQSTRNTLYPNGYGESNNSFDSILTCGIKLNDFTVLRKYMLQLSYQTPDTKCHMLGNQAFKGLMDAPKSCMSFYKLFCDVPVMRRSFFELLADPDFDLPYYDIAIQKYLNATKKDSSLQNIQDNMFGLSLLTRHYFLHNKSNPFENYSHMLSKYDNDVIRNRREINTFPKARFFLYKIFLYKAFKSEKQQYDYEEWLLDFITEEQKSFSFQDSKIWIHTILDMRSFLIEPIKFEKAVHSIINRFKNMYPSDFTNHDNCFKIQELLDFTNQNSSAYWKKIWKN